jgi:hypothetical protein
VRDASRTAKGSKWARNTHGLGLDGVVSGTSQGQGEIKRGSGTHPLTRREEGDVRTPE